MSKGYLTTHVLDTYNGKPGSGIKGSVYIFNEGNKKKIKEFTLNEDGRCDGPILENDNFKAGKYEIKFSVEIILKNSQNLVIILF